MHHRLFFIRLLIFLSFLQYLCANNYIIIEYSTRIKTAYVSTTITVPLKVPTVTYRTITCKPCRDFTQFFCCKQVIKEKSTKIVIVRRTILAKRYITEKYCKVGYEEIKNIGCKPNCSLPCLNGGICTAPNTCSCTDSWRGDQCQDDVDECMPKASPCMHQCTNHPGGYRCSCFAGFYQPAHNITACERVHIRIESILVGDVGLQQVKIQWRLSTTGNMSHLIRSLRIHVRKIGDQLQDSAILNVEHENQFVYVIGLRPDKYYIMTLEPMFSSSFNRNNRPIVSGNNVVTFRTLSIYTEGCRNFMNNLARRQILSSFIGNPCLNNGYCVDVLGSSTNEYTCRCTGNYTGDNCESSHSNNTTRETNQTAPANETNPTAAYS